MRGLLEAVLVLASALVRGAGAVPQQENVPSSALITIKLPTAELNEENQYLSFRFDVLESSEACGFVNATINGRLLSQHGSLAIPLDPKSEEEDGSDTQGSAIVNWTNHCSASDDQAREQRLQLSVTSISGVALTREDLEDSDLIIRFRQTAPVRIIDVEGAASAFRFSESPALIGSNDGTGATAGAAVDLDAAELAAWQQSLAAMHQHALLVQHDIRAREQYMRQRFGSSSVKLACSDRSFLGALFHRISSLMGKSSWEDDAIRIQDSSGGGSSSSSSSSWEQMYPPYEPPVCGSNNNTRVGPPPPPVPPPPFLLHCMPQPPNEDGGGDHYHKANNGSEDGSWHSPTGNVGPDGEAQAESQTSWPGHDESSGHSLRGMFTYLMTVAAISCLIICAVHYCRDRLRDGQVSGGDVERGDSGSRGGSGSSGGSGGSGGLGRFSNSSRWRHTNVRQRLSDRWQRLSTRFQERRDRGRARRQTRQQVRREDRAVPETVGAKIVRFLKRILSVRGVGGEKLVGAGARQQNRAAGTARGHIEAVVVPPPTPPRESFGQQREEERRQLLEEQLLRQQQQQQERDEELLRQQQWQQQQQLLQQERLERQLREQEEQIQYQQLLQQQMQRHRREQQAAREQEQEERQRQQQRYQRSQQIRQRKEQQMTKQAEAEAEAEASQQKLPGAEHERTPSPTMEQEIASFRAAADVVDQIIAAEEGRMSGQMPGAAQTTMTTTTTMTTAAAAAAAAQTQRRQDQQKIMSSLSRGSSLPLASSTVLSTTRSNGASSLSTASVVAAGHTAYGYERRYERRNLGGIDSDFDDTESLPPAYSETGFSEDGCAGPSSTTAAVAGFSESAYSYVDLAEAEASMVADGFQYHPGSNGY